MDRVAQLTRSRMAVTAVGPARNVLQGSDRATNSLAAATGQNDLVGQMVQASPVGGGLRNCVPRATTGTDARVVGEPDAHRALHKLNLVLAQRSETPESVERWRTDTSRLEGLLKQVSNKPASTRCACLRATNPAAGRQAQQRFGEPASGHSRGPHRTRSRIDVR